MKTQRFTAILIAVMLLVCSCSAGISESGDDLMIKTEHCSVSAAMLEYFFYGNFYDLYANDADYYGLDLNLTFTEQMYSKGVSWQQHLSELALEIAKRYVLLKEDAIAEGFEFSPDVDSRIDEYSYNATVQGISLDDYLKDYYGDKATEQTVRDALELQLYASEYEEILKDGYIETLDEADYDKYYTENRQNIEIVDIITYSIPINYYGVINSEKRDSLLACESEEEFKQWIANDLTEKNESLDEPKSPEELQAKIVEKTEVVRSYYTEGGDFSEWAFDEDTELYDTHYAEKNTGMYDIYMIVKKPYAWEKYDHNIGRIHLSAKDYSTAQEASDAATAIIEEFEASGGTAEVFESLIEKYGDAESNFSNNVADNSFSQDEINQWLKDDQRTEGDISSFMTGDGCYIIYYAGRGMQRWMSDATNSLAQGYVDTYLAEFEEVLTDTLTVKENITDILPEALPGVSLG